MRGRTDAGITKRPLGLYARKQKVLARSRGAGDAFFRQLVGVIARLGGRALYLHAFLAGFSTQAVNEIKVVPIFKARGGGVVALPLVAE